MTRILAPRPSSRSPGIPRPLRILCATALLASLLLLGGCTGDDAEPERGRECPEFKPHLENENPFFPVDTTYVDPDLLGWPTSEPGDVGLDGAVLEEAATELAMSPVAASLLVARHGKLAFERYFNGFEAAEDRRNAGSVGFPPCS